jgi:hypothetical protein
MCCDVNIDTAHFDRVRIVVAPVDYQDILKTEGTRDLPLQPYLWRQNSSANPSPIQLRCRALSRWRALPVLPMALLLPKRRQLLASLMEADIIINLFVLDQMGLVSAANAGKNHFFLKFP